MRRPQHPSRSPSQSKAIANTWLKSVPAFYTCTCAWMGFGLPRTSHNHYSVPKLFVCLCVCACMCLLLSTPQSSLLELHVRSRFAKASFTTCQPLLYAHTCTSPDCLWKHCAFSSSRTVISTGTILPSCRASAFVARTTTPSSGFSSECSRCQRVLGSHIVREISAGSWHP